MTLTNTTQNTIQKRTERSEVHSRPKGVNPQDHSRTNLNQRLTRIHQKTGSFGKVQEELIRYQWENSFLPKWFITLHWNDLPTRPEVIQSHARHFRNVLLTTLLNKSLKKLPGPAFRTKLVFFHERSFVVKNNKSILAFHTHLHLESLPDHQNHQWFLEHIVHHQVKPHVQKLLKATNTDNEGVVIKPWVWDHHAFYNLKDYYSYKHHQDSDLVIDYLNSDLIFPTE